MRKLNTAKIKVNLIDTLFDIIGGALYAAGIYSFAAKAQFAPGGIAGLGVIINHYTGLPIGVCTLVLNIPVIFICLRALGRNFLFRSLRTMIIGTVLMDFVFPLLPAYGGDKLVAALFAGALSGLGLALIYWRGSSTGGMDFVILSLRKKYPHLSIGTISIITDGAVILLGGLIFKNVDAVLEGILMTAVYTTVVDKLMSSFAAGQVVFVITDKGGEMSDRIMRSIGRGVTAVSGTGMFSKENRNILMCACTRSEACRIRKLAYNADNEALVLLCPYDTAYGMGFEPLAG